MLASNYDADDAGDSLQVSFKAWGRPYDPYQRRTIQFKIVRFKPAAALNTTSKLHHQGGRREGRVSWPGTACRMR